MKRQPFGAGLFFLGLLCGAVLLGPFSRAPEPAFAKPDYDLPFPVDDCGLAVCTPAPFPTVLLPPTPAPSATPTPRRVTRYSVPTNMGGAAGGSVDYVTLPQADLKKFRAGKRGAPAGSNTLAITLWNTKLKRMQTVYLPSTSQYWIVTCTITAGKPCPFQP